ncbi:MAG: hypothetical protein ABH886_03030 [Candidatus Desantisbacteria bacterium]
MTNISFVLDSLSLVFLTFIIIAVIGWAILYYQERRQQTHK